MSVLGRTPPRADFRLRYGDLPEQFGDLRVPRVRGGELAPVVVMIHGGWWRNEYSLDYLGFACESLRAAGVATWSLEYRRVGDVGGGFPGTMADVGAGFDYLIELEKTHPLDLTRLITAGHSAGGQLAFWLAGRRHIPRASPLHDPQPRVLPVAVVGLAGAVDLRLCEALGGVVEFRNARESALALMGGPPSAVPERYRAANPGDLLPFGCQQVLLQGTEDDQIPPRLPERWAELARRQGDRVDVHVLPATGHFDVVDPQSRAWPTVRAAMLRALTGL